MDQQTLGLAAQAVRGDRILYEAIATGGDVRKLFDLFGLSVEDARRYTAALGHPALTGQAPASNDPSRRAARQ